MTIKIDPTYIKFNILFTVVGRKISESAMAKITLVVFIILFICYQMNVARAKPTKISDDIYLPQMFIRSSSDSGTYFQPIKRSGSLDYERM